MLALGCGRGITRPEDKVNTDNQTFDRTAARATDRMQPARHAVDIAPDGKTTFTGG
jgi:hypothetical protein